ncbi:MAG: hypothetical protein ACYTF0_07775 [Planctomycetota bacterium]|jgi:hypothetical protein
MPIALLGLLLALLNQACAVDSDDFDRYWYDQGAEITTYHLNQARYGEQHSGRAVLVFVTEPFNSIKQVKSDDPQAAAAVPVLKLNHLRHFVTGIYDYHCMSSVFQPTNSERALKVSTSVQEWCGHIFEQFNRRDDGWQWRRLSYFEHEGDSSQPIGETWLEDELWTRLRLDPASLPLGQVMMVPAALARRFHQRDASALKAEVSIINHDRHHDRLEVHYPTIDRRLRIIYRRDFPHHIEGWNEHEAGAHTSAQRQQRRFGPYWQWHSNADRARRAELGLDLAPDGQPWRP